MSEPSHLVWIDLEMTGVDPERCRILEIATIVTNSELEIVAEGPDLVIHQPDEVLAGMAEHVRRMHGDNGLLERVRGATLTEAQAEAGTLEFLERHVAREQAPLCGNTVWKDRLFLKRYMPALDSFLHYRNVDVSTVKELVLRWYAGVCEPPAKKQTHRARDDIRESIEELRFYRAHVFRR